METAVQQGGEQTENPLTWSDVLQEERGKEYFQKILSFVEQERRSGQRVYPPNKEIFNAFHHTPFCEVKVVIIGQDPYFGPGQAHGLCFSVPSGVPAPPSLKNIFQELESDLGIPRPNHGSLERWADQGVFLLNAVLSVRAGKAGSHAGIGWERFTDTVIRVLGERREGLVFLLWGSFAQKKAALLPSGKHTVLTAPHPSPLSAHRGFFGCSHFSKANAALTEQGIAPIDWDLSS